MTEHDWNGHLPSFVPGDRVTVLPLNVGATVIRQLKSYDGAGDQWVWGNVQLQYDDGTKGISNSWQLRKV